MNDFLDIGFRRQCIQELESPENIARKQEAYRRYEIYRKRQDPYIMRKLCQEFSAETVREMRKIFSINLAPKIIDELASIYNTEPDRTFTTTNEKELEQIYSLYANSKFDTKMKRANRLYKIPLQPSIAIMPIQDIIDVRPIPQHQFDVIPFYDNPEKAEAYILSSYDKKLHSEQYSKANSYVYSDGVNQYIADPDDYSKKDSYMNRNKRYTWWTKDYHFTTDYSGNIVQYGDRDISDIENPIGILPFIDVTDGDKDCEFFERFGSTVTDFTIDYAVLLSDTANTNRLQSYSQAILYAKEVPKEFIVGPNSILHIPIDENMEKDPKFEFASPSPDMNASLQLLDNYLSVFLTTMGVDPNVVNSKGNQVKYNSGFDRLLAMIEKFQASKEDFALFRSIEMKSFDIMKSWQNIFYGSQNSPLNKESYNISKIQESTKLNIKFHEPQMIKTETDILDNAQKKLDIGITSPARVLAELEDISLDEAIDKLQSIKEELDAETINNI